jgi:agmatinase
VSPPFDHAEITAYLAGRVVLEALSGIAWRRRRAAGDPVRHPADPLLANRPAGSPEATRADRHDYS